MDTADRARDKSARAPMTVEPTPDRNTLREREPASSPDHPPPCAPPDHYRVQRNSPHTAPKNLPLASGSRPRPNRSKLRPTLTQNCDRNPRLRRPSSPLRPVASKSPHTSPLPRHNL